MSGMTFGQKLFKPVPPDKGSFPLDHFGECQRLMMKYMLCLREHSYESSACRPEAKDYLSCRMDKQLMAKEDWSKLGYADMLSEEKEAEKSNK